MLRKLIHSISSFITAAGTVKKTRVQLTVLLDSWTASKRIHDYYFFKIKELIITPKVRLKCMNGCPDYNKAKKCPPAETLSPEQCWSYLQEYTYGIILRFYPGKNQLCPEDAQTSLLELERKSFSLNNPYALAIFPRHCTQCDECGKNEPCKNPVNARFSISSMCIDILGTMAKLGTGQSILTEKDTPDQWYYVGLVLVD